MATTFSLYISPYVLFYISCQSVSKERERRERGSGELGTGFWVARRLTGGLTGIDCNCQ